ncbi:uncharacterized protein LOC124989039 isoform X3 [Sciurus carolinensis]|uniref:uncharacterized protein LOC124989039 isoform X3 n=1 Tax=Sciurus carolinensis TaxID=30640 RepID=UPI001FB32EB9|nr:uncharacterized protein LOC124989039 isoform X3 [Sciurus carolinensis]
MWNLEDMSNYEDFWKLIQEEGHGTEIKEKLQRIKFKMSNPRPQAAPRRRESRPLVDAERQDRPCQRGQTRTSALGPEPSLPRTQEESQHPPLKGLLSQVTEWRKRSQQREEAGKLAPGQGKSKIVCKAGEKDSRSKMYLRRLYQMYSTSLANMEFSRRHNPTEHVRGEPASSGMTTAPLTLEHMIPTHRVVEAKTGSRYWINYVDKE